MLSGKWFWKFLGRHPFAVEVATWVAGLGIVLLIMAILRLALWIVGI